MLFYEMLQAIAFLEVEDKRHDKIYSAIVTYTMHLLNYILYNRSNVSIDRVDCTRWGWGGG